MFRDSTPPALAVLGGLSHRAANSLHGLSSRWSVNPIATKLILGSVLIRSLWNSSTASAQQEVNTYVKMDHTDVITQS